MQAAAPSVDVHAKCMQKLKSGQRIERRRDQSPQAIGVEFELNNAHSRGTTMVEVQHQKRSGVAVLTAEVTVKFVTAGITF